MADRLRPQNLDEFVGQSHLLGKGKILRNLIESDMLSSMIFWGPPGVGKTTLAKIIANRTKSSFIEFSAVTSGIKEIREIMKQAESNRFYGEKTIVFVDEIHRYTQEDDMRLRARLGFTVVAVLLVFAVTAFAADKGEALRGAAETGDADAQYNLGVMHYQGEGVAQDPKQAATWFRRAAE